MEGGKGGRRIVLMDWNYHWLTRIEMSDDDDDVEGQTEEKRREEGKYRFITRCCCCCCSPSSFLSRLEPEG